MKTKKMILGITAAVFVFAVVFMACKKNKEDATTTKQDPVASTTTASAARSTGVQTYYSKSATSGAYYKMVVSWALDGSVTIDRTTVTSPPAGTETVWQFGDNTAYTTYDHDTTSLGIDSIKIACVPGKYYHFVPFTPGASDYPIPGGAGVALSCRCVAGGGFCLLIQVNINSNISYTCHKQTCNTCLLTGISRYDNTTVISETNLTAGNAGGVFFEASAITITH